MKPEYNMQDGYQNAALMLWDQPTSGMAMLWIDQCAIGQATYQMLELLDAEADRILAEVEK